MKIDIFENIKIWQKSRILASNVYRVFKPLKDFSFRDQIQRASVSVMNNIAEGYERSSNKEFKKFLYIAKGSVAEVRSMIYLGLDYKYLTKDEFDVLYSQSEEISKMLSGLIKVLK